MYSRLFGRLICLYRDSYLFCIKNIGSQQDIPVHFCLAGIIVANGIDVHPAATVLSVKIVLYCLSAVTVVIISAPMTESSSDLQAVT